MIVAHDVHVAARPFALRGATFTVGAGVHALLGAASDGPRLLLSVLAGRVRVRAGTVRVLGAAPSDAAVRRAIAYIPRDVTLPRELRVREMLAVAAEIRGDGAAAPEDRLAKLDLASLAPRPVASLAPPEARAVAIAEALTSPGVRVLLLEEPFVLVDPRLEASLTTELRAAGARGVAVVVATASPRDASALAETCLLFDRGALVRTSAGLDPAFSAPPTGARIRVLASNARALLAALATEEAVQSVETEGTAILAHGSLLPELAAAVWRAAVRARVEVLEMRPDLLPLDELRAANAGAAAAYQAAYARTASAAKAKVPSS